jgi:hypothetical protein
MREEIAMTICVTMAVVMGLAMMIPMQRKVRWMVITSGVLLLVAFGTTMAKPSERDATAYDYVTLVSGVVSVAASVVAIFATFLAWAHSIPEHIVSTS